MDRVRLAMSLEGIAAFPQSNDGRLAGSDPEQTTLGEVVEDRYNYDDDDCLDGIGRLNKAAQAGVWRQKIEKACSQPEVCALRIYYATDSGTLENACKVLGNILTIEGRSSHYVMVQCWIMAMTQEDADDDVIDMVGDLFNSARKKADKVVM